MQHKILLLDELGDRWGKTHIYHDLKSPCEALKLLYINHPDLKKYFATAHENGISFTVVQAGEFLNYEDLALPLGKNDLVITPVITGSKGVGKVLLGVGLVLATGGFGASFGTGTLFGSTALGSFGAKIGAALIIGGVSDMITPQPQLPTFDFDAPVSGFAGGPTGVTRGSDGSQSYAYTGAANTVGLGKTIPVVYGEALIGGHILSTNIEVANESDKLMKYIRPPSLDTVRLNGEEIKYKYTSAGGMKARRYDGSKGNAQGTARYIQDTTIDLTKTGEQFLKKQDGTNLTEITGDDSGNQNTKKFQIYIRVSGLVDFVGNDQSTKIDGFITYRVIIKEKDSGNLVLNSQATIQGLTTSSQKFSYIAKLPYQYISGKDKYQVKIKIIDQGVDTDQCKFIVRQIGYNLKTS
tara:strand:+ start:372 stop:1601 length:1230 start_codon:yes stop_codon:yes gene_type:complete